MNFYFFRYKKRLGFCCSAAMQWRFLKVITLTKLIPSLLLQKIFWGLSYIKYMYHLETPITLQLTCVINLETKHDIQGLFKDTKSERLLT